MRCVLICSLTLAVLSVFLPGNLTLAQDEKKPLVANGWGSLKGKVTLDGKVPDIVDLTPAMMKHADKACCLAKDAKPEEKIDLTWVVNPKTKEVANVVVWIMPPNKMYFPLPANYKSSKDAIVIDQPHCAFLPRVSAYNPVNIVNGKEVATGQTVTFKNSAVVSHNIRATGSPAKEKNSFNVNVPAKTEITKSFEAQRLPITIQCDVHPWMSGRLFVFDHPYFAITKEDGSYEIPQVPAGAEVFLMVYHEGVGWVLPELGKGKAVTLKAGENVRNFEVKAPKAEK